MSQLTEAAILDNQKAQIATADTYEALKKQVFQQVWNHIRRAGGDFDEAKSVAHEAFMLAYNNFDQSRGVQFNTYLWHCVRGRLLNQRNSRLKTNTLDTPCSKDSDARSVAASIPDRIPSGLQWLLNEVSEDARVIIGLVVEAPDELAVLTRTKNPERWRKALWDRLRAIDWTMGRVATSFDEIKEALQ